MSQGDCESRDIIYDHSAKPVMSVVSNFLIKKSSCFFTNGCLCSLPRRGAPIYNWKK